uniref:ATP-binding protein n=1 Tax=candidate division WOR-3 bacterium TaxID=2052148 RepID=A0A7C4TD87_UNCW3
MLIKDYLIEYQRKSLPSLIERELRLTETKRRIISIIGPRRAGKTYYLYQMIKRNKEKSLYLNFEDTRLFDIDFREIREIIRIYNEMAKKEPECLFFDEIQNIKGWEYALREILDMNKYKIFITGSSSKLLSKEIATSLRGRTLTYTLLPFSFTEFCRARKISFDIPSKDEEVNIKRVLREYLEFGGFPEVILEEEKERILKEFSELILFKDIVERHNLKNINLAKFLLAHFIQNFSQEISVNKILNFFKSQGKKFGKNTLYDYIDKIQDSMAIFFVSRYSEKVYTRASWPKKIYLCDSGISKVAKFSQDWGKLMENVVFLELLRKTNKLPLMEIYYFKTENGREVDFVVKEGIKIKELIQVSYDTDKPETKQRALKSLIKASDYLQCKDLSLINWDYEEEETFGEKKIKFIPLWKWLLRSSV